MTRSKDSAFWDQLEQLVVKHKIIIDRPQGSAHPRFPEVVYPLDYGYLEGTTSKDGGGIDVWIGHKGDKVLTSEMKPISAIILTTDLKKPDAEIKIALNCDEKDLQTILAFHKRNKMGAMVVKKHKG
jgi:inorganic pyrophosphatase